MSATSYRCYYIQRPLKTIRIALKKLLKRLYTHCALMIYFNSIRILFPTVVIKWHLQFKGRIKYLYITYICTYIYLKDGFDTFHVLELLINSKYAIGSVLTRATIELSGVKSRIRE